MKSHQIDYQLEQQDGSGSAANVVVEVVLLYLRLSKLRLRDT